MKKLSYLLLFWILANIANAKTTITNVSVQPKGDQVIISYDLNNSNASALFDVYVKLYNSKNEVIEATAFTGDYGKSVSVGNNKKAIWQVKVDNISLSETVYAVVEAYPSFHVSVGKHLFKSAIFPGIGEYRLDNKKMHFFKGLMAYGAVAGSVALNMSAIESYNNYLNASSQGSNYFSMAQSQQLLSFTLAGTAAVIWGYSAIKTYVKAKRLKKLKEITTDQSEYYYNYTNRSIIGQSVPKYLEIKGKFIPPNLLIVDGSLSFQNSNNEPINIINALESATLKFKLENNGKGDAYEVNVYISELKNNKHLSFTKVINLGKIKKGEIQNIEIPIKSNIELTSGLATFKIKVTERSGDGAEEQAIITTSKFMPPQIQIVSHEITTEKGGKAKKSEKITLTALVQNTGSGDAKDVKIDFLNPTGVISLDEQSKQFSILKSGEYKEVVYDFAYNKELKDTVINIQIILTESWKKYGENKMINYVVNQDLNIKSNNFIGEIRNTEPVKLVTIKSDVDINIPVSKEKNDNKYAIVIGNEDYSSRQSSLTPESNVAFANIDARVFKDYLVQTLGFDIKNVVLINNATASEMKSELFRLGERIKRLENPRESEIIFYYAGHGYPDEITKVPYLIPVDVSASDLSSAITLSYITDALAKTNAKRITLFLDACFTGEGRGAGLLAARSARVLPKSFDANGNMVIFSATSADQTALPYTDKKHGFFTYYLLKKMQETKGDVKYSELFDYIKRNVSLESTRLIKPQDPSIKYSNDIIKNWGSWKLNDK
jgi:hypothetical protein